MLECWLLLGSFTNFAQNVFTCEEASRRRSLHLVDFFGIVWAASAVVNKLKELRGRSVHRGQHFTYAHATHIVIVHSRNSCHCCCRISASAPMTGCVSSFVSHQACLGLTKTVNVLWRTCRIGVKLRVCCITRRLIIVIRRRLVHPLNCWKLLLNLLYLVAPLLHNFSAFLGGIKAWSWTLCLKQLRVIHGGPEFLVLPGNHSLYDRLVSRWVKRRGGRFLIILLLQNFFTFDGVLQKPLLFLLCYRLWRLSWSFTLLLWLFGKLELGPFYLFFSSWLVGMHVGICNNISISRLICIHMYLGQLTDL